MAAPRIKKISLQEIEPDLRPKAALFDQKKDSFLTPAEVDTNNNGYLDARFVNEGKITLQEYDRLQYALFRKGIVSKFRPPASSSELPRGVEIVTEIEGNREVGTIVYVRQFHDRPEFNDLQREVVADYQYEILKFLLDRKETDLFPESQTEEVLPGKMLFVNSTNENEIFLELIRDNYKNPLPENHDKIQGHFLKNFPAAILYAALNRQATLRKTISSEQDEEIFKNIKGGSSLENVLPLVMDLRESLASEEIRKFLEKHPGRTVILIYGLAHEFKDDFMKWKKPPTLVSIKFGEPSRDDIRIASLKACMHTQNNFNENKNSCSWINLNEVNYSNPDELTPIFALSKERPNLQSQIIRKALTVPVWGFQYIASAEGQMEALDKMNLREMSLDKKYFLDHAQSEKVKQKIEQKFSEIENSVKALMRELISRLLRLIPFF